MKKLYICIFIITLIINCSKKSTETNIQLNKTYWASHFYIHMNEYYFTNENSGYLLMFSRQAEEYGAIPELRELEYAINKDELLIFHSGLTNKYKITNINNTIVFESPYF